MIYGIIDLGSNTIRLSIFKYNDGKIKLLSNKKEIVGLALCVENGRLTEKGIEKTCEILNKYRESLENAQVKVYSVFATASLRNIKNKDEVLQEIKAKTGMEPEILFGEEEARLGFLAVKSEYDVENGIVIDIGGGSTEIVVFEEGEIRELTSIPIGALNLQDGNVPGLVAKEKDIKRMRRIVSKALDKLDWENKEYSQMYAVGGTARATLKVAKELFGVPVESKSFSRVELKGIIRKMKSEVHEEYKSVYKIIPERIFSFAGGISILSEIVKKFNCTQINISKAGIREGYFIDRIVNYLKENQKIKEAEEKVKEEILEKDEAGEKIGE
ncbi:phosphatase [Fusobacterium mortiferum]|jgi:exopolyphosphatase/guanosine-5'-triphosphate,3'-diphosphate pyrophosphatase|uniref:Phosphatase n=1 Tax=Fusobacterium mortiferum TaxID=850 RepID=A0A414PV81_FUSMR|nr:phosphatase [Fusobacterium mortiferum]RHF72464.1 phosphatase [Fusobacterium mortiferum]